MCFAPNPNNMNAIVQFVKRLILVLSTAKMGFIIMLDTLLIVVPKTAVQL